MTTKYIKITNKTGLVSRINLEKLGLSSKRNDPNTIGQFGSGIKFAPIAALRKGWEWWFAGEDSNGQYVMKYDTEIEDGIECVIYNYGNYTKTSSFTLDAGVLSWIDAFQIYREAIANALDEAGGDQSKWYIDIVDVDNIKPTSGEFSVFITASPELLNIHNNYDKYFSTNRKFLNKVSRVDFLEKVDHQFRVYCHNVLVFNHSEYTSIFDYNINSLILNEERNIKSTIELEWQITEALAYLNDPDLIEKVIFADKTNDVPFELARMASSIINYHTPAVAWCVTFYKIYGENSVILTPEAAMHGVESSIQLRGYKPVIINNQNFYKFLVAAGVKNYQDTLGEQVSLSIDYNYKNYANLNKAINIVSQYIPTIKELALSERLGVFTSDIDQNLGLTLNINKSKDERLIVVNSSHVSDPVEDIVATLTHEFDHYDTGIGDNDFRKFRDLSDRRVSKMMVNFYKENIFTISDGLIKFSPSDCAYFDGEIICNVTKIDEHCNIMKIGKKYFMINSGANISDSVYITLSESGKDMCVNGISNVTLVREINV